MGRTMHIAGALVAVAACGGARADVEPRPKPAPQPRAVIAAAASTSAAPAPVPTTIAPPPPPPEDPSAWKKSLHPAPLRVHAGDTAWAALADGDAVRVVPVHVVDATATSATVEDDEKKRFAGISGLVLHPMHDRAGVKPGDVVTYYDWRHDLGLAVVEVKRDYMSPTHFRAKYRDSRGVIRHEPTEYQEPLPAGVEPMAWITFPLRGAVHRGLVVAVDGDDVIVRDDARAGHRVRKADVKPLAIARAPLKPGDGVIAYAPELGYQPATIAHVFVPGWAYGVKLNGEDEPRPLVTTDLAESL